MLSKKFLLWTMALLCACCTMLPAQELVFSTQPSASKVGLNDQFQVSFVLQNARNVSAFNAPSFQGFHVLAGPIQSSQSSYTEVNGRMQQRSSIRLSYVLQPEKKGVLIIDGATVTVDGQSYSSNPVTIQVVPGSLATTRHNQRQNPDDPFADDPVFQAMQRRSQQIQRMMQQQMQQMQQQTGGTRAMPRRQDLTGLDEKNLKNNVFIKVTVDNTHPYVGQQITASYKLYARLPMNMNLTQLPSLNGFWSEDFNIPMPPKPSIEKIEGKKYQVFLLKKSALFPQHAGKLVLDPAKAAGMVRVIEQSDNNQSPLADDPGFGSLFMNDPFFNNGYYSKYQYRDVKTELSSKPVTINVQELPAAGQPKNFTGAVGHFTINATIDSTILHTGNSANFVFTIKGSGNFKLIGNPVIPFPHTLSALDPLVADTITGRSPNITGMKTFTYNLSPQETGSYTIPAIDFSYFDPDTKNYKTLHTQPITVIVKTGKGANNGQNVATTRLSDIHPNITASLNLNNSTLCFVVSLWYWSIYLLGILIFVMAYLLHKRKNDMAANAVLWKNKKANKVAWKRLALARKLLPKQGAHNAFYEEVSKAVWLYLSDKLNIPISGLSKENIAGKLKKEGLATPAIDQTQNVISECEMALYSPSGGTKQRAHTLENAAQLIGALEEFLGKKKTEKNAS